MTTTVVERYSHRVELNTLEATLLSELTAKANNRDHHDTSLNEINAPKRLQLAREFFQRMAG